VIWNKCVRGGKELDDPTSHQIYEGVSIPAIAGASIKKLVGGTFG
jgi:hypothetical protein